MHGLLHQLKDLHIDTDQFNEELHRQDGCLGCLLVKVPSDESAEVADLTVCFEGMGLDFARISLLCVTNRKEVALEEFKGIEGFDEAGLDALVASCRKQPAFEQLPGHLCSETRTICEFTTQLLGVTYRIRCRNKLGPLLFAETLLGVLESALALAKWENFAFVVDEVKLFFDEAAEGETPPKTNFVHFGCVREQKLIWKPGMLEWMRNNVGPLRQFLFRLLLEILFTSTIDPMEDIKKELDIWEKQRSFERALNSSPTSIPLLDLLGPEKYDLTNWINASPASAV